MSRVRGEVGEALRLLRATLAVGTLLAGGAWAQSPYALVGSDRQAGGPIGWPEDATLEEITERVMEAWALDDGFFGAVLTARDRQVGLRRALGWANVEHRVPNGVDTRFPISFLSMQVTAAALGRLVELGKVDLDDRLVEWLPGAHPMAEGITLRHLLETRSGLEQDLFLDAGPSRMEGLFDFDSLLRLVAGVEVRDAPGERFSFSGPRGVSVDYILLGAVVERVSGRRFEDFVTSEVFRPLEMGDSGFLSDPRVVPRLATSYQRILGTLERYPSGEYGFLRSSGAVYSSIDDLYRFLAATLEGGVLGPAVRDAVESSLGVRSLALVDGRLMPASDAPEGAATRRYVGTNGWSNGASIMLSYFPDRGDLLLIVSNVHRAAEIYDMRRRWAQALFGLPVGMPLPKAAARLWEILEQRGVAAAARFYGRRVERGLVGDLPISDQFQHLSRELRRRSRFAEALRVSRLYVELQPDFWIPHRELGEVYRLMGQRAEAADAFGKALARGADIPAWEAEMRAFLASE